LALSGGARKAARPLLCRRQHTAGAVVEGVPGAVEQRRSGSPVPVPREADVLGTGVPVRREAEASFFMSEPADALVEQSPNQVGWKHRRRRCDLY
jgi:hypothetical protein